MKRNFFTYISVLAVSLFLLLPTVMTAEEPTGENPCDKIKQPDDRNFCLATGINKGEKYGYTSKDHSTYYCSLIKSRDKQAYCNALINKTKNSCGLIVDKKLEEECNSHF